MVHSPSPLSSVQAEVFHRPPRGPESHSTACCSKSSHQPPRQPPLQQRVCELLCLPQSPATLLQCGDLGPRRHGTAGELAHAKLSNEGENDNYVCGKSVLWSCDFISEVLSSLITMCYTLTLLLDRLTRQSLITWWLECECRNKSGKTCGDNIEGTLSVRMKALTISTTSSWAPGR